MAKNQIYFWTLILFFPNVWGLEAKIFIPTQSSKRYVRFEDIQKEFPSLKSSFNPATFVGAIRHPSGEVRFRVGSSFYTFNQSIEKISVPVLYKEKDFLIPPEIVEAIFVQLMSEDVRYEYKENVLELEILPSVEKLEVKTILIDAGHGGKDPGTASNDGTNEKLVALQVAKILQKFFEKVYPTINVVLTRSDDTFVELERRSEIANRELKKKRKRVVRQPTLQFFDQRGCERIRDLLSFPNPVHRVGSRNRSSGKQNFQTERNPDR